MATEPPISPRQNNLSKAIGIVAVCLLAGLLLAIWVRTHNQSSTTTTPVVEKIDLNDLRAKAERGEADAQKKLGRLYVKGEGVPQSYAEAAKWYLKAAEQGLTGAQNALGELYEAGRGVPLDEKQAANWYRRAAEQGDAAGQYNLAVLYVLGKGVPQDNAEALKWYRLAAEQGDSLAQFNLGMRYTEGKGVTADPVEAYKWMSLAAAQGLKDASNARDELKRRMTSEQVKEGRRRTEAFAAKKPAPRAQ